VQCQLGTYKITECFHKILLSPEYASPCWIVLLFLYRHHKRVTSCPVVLPTVCPRKPARTSALHSQIFFLFFRWKHSLVPVSWHALVDLPSNWLLSFKYVSQHAWLQPMQRYFYFVRFIASALLPILKSAKNGRANGDQVRMPFCQITFFSRFLAYLIFCLEVTSGMGKFLPFIFCGTQVRLPWQLMLQWWGIRAFRANQCLYL